MPKQHILKNIIYSGLAESNHVFLLFHSRSWSQFERARENIAHALLTLKALCNFKTWVVLEKCIESYDFFTINIKSLINGYLTKSLTWTL